MQVWPRSPPEPRRRPRFPRPFSLAHPARAVRPRRAEANGGRAAPSRACATPNHPMIPGWVRAAAARRID